MTRTRTRIAAALLTGAALTTACGTDAATQPEVPIGGSADPFPATTPDPDDPAEQARQQATGAIEEYIAVESALIRAPETDLAVIETVAAGRGADLLTGDVEGYLERGVRGTGDAVVAEMTITNVNVTGDVAEVVAQACIDLTQVRALDAAGEDITSPDRPDRVLNTYTVTNNSWPDMAAWRVSDSQARNTPCDAP